MSLEISSRWSELRKPKKRAFVLEYMPRFPLLFQKSQTKKKDLLWKQISPAARSTAVLLLCSSVFKFDNIKKNASGRSPHQAPQQPNSDFNKSSIFMRQATKLEAPSGPVLVGVNESFPTIAQCHTINKLRQVRRNKPVSHQRDLGKLLLTV